MRVRLRLGPVLGDLDAAGLPAAADLHLRLDHAGIADLVSGRDRLLDRGGGRPGGHRDPVAGESCLPWYSSRSMTGADPSGDSQTAIRRCHNARPHAAAQGSHVRHIRRLRHPDRLGDRGLRRLRQGGRPGRLHALARGADPALHADPAGDQGRVLRAVRRGPAPHRRADLARAGLAARALAVRVPARLRLALAAVQGDQHPARALRQEVRGRAHLQRRRQAARPHAAPLQGRLRPRGHRPAGPLLQARPGALQGGRAADRRQEGLGARGVELLLRRRAVHEGEGAGDLGQPVGETLEPGAKKPTAEVKSLLEAARLLGAA